MSTLDDWLAAAARELGLDPADLMGPARSLPAAVADLAGETCPIHVLLGEQGVTRHRPKRLWAAV